MDAATQSMMLTTITTMNAVAMDDGPRHVTQQAAQTPVEVQVFLILIVLVVILIGAAGMASTTRR